PDMTGKKELWQSFNALLADEHGTRPFFVIPVGYPAYHPFEEKTILFFKQEYATEADLMELLPLSLVQKVIGYKNRTTDFMIDRVESPSYDPWGEVIHYGKRPHSFLHEVGHLLFARFLARGEEELDFRTETRMLLGYFGRAGEAMDVRDDEVPALVREYQRLVGAVTCQKLNDGTRSHSNDVGEHFADNIMRLCCGAPFLTTARSKATTEEILDYFVNKAGLITEAEAAQYRVLSAGLNNGHPVAPLRSDYTAHLDLKEIREARSQSRIIRKMREKGRELTLAEEIAARFNQPDEEKTRRWLEQDPDGMIQLLRLYDVSHPALEELIEEFMRRRAYEAQPAKTGEAGIVVLDGQV
ncbi:MAG: hypothetical protein WCG78_05895, partial [Candidatus Omnitrophota bacterium]